MTLVSRNVRFMRICAGIPRGGASDGSVVIDNDNFWRLFSVATWKLGMPALLYGDKQSLAGFN